MLFWSWYFQMLEDKMRQCLLSLCCQHEKVQLCIAVESQLLSRGNTRLWCEVFLNWVLEGAQTTTFRALTCASLAESRHRGWWRAGDIKTFAKKIIIIYWLTLILSRHFRDLLVADEISDHQLGARSQFQLDHSVRGSVHHLLWIVTNNCHVTKNLTDLAALLNGCEAKVKTACSTENVPNITEVSCLSSSLQIRVDHGVARSPPAWTRWWRHRGLRLLEQRQLHRPRHDHQVGSSSSSSLL